MDFNLISQQDLWHCYVMVKQGYLPIPIAHLSNEPWQYPFNNTLTCPVVNRLWTWPIRSSLSRRIVSEFAFRHFSIDLFESLTSGNSDNKIGAVVEVKTRSERTISNRRIII